MWCQLTVGCFKVNKSMFKMLVVVCAIGIDCIPFNENSHAVYTDIKSCEKQTGKKVDELWPRIKDDPAFTMMWAGCVPVNQNDR